MSNIRFINTIACVPLLALMVLSGCAEPEGPVGANVGDNGIGGEADSVVIAADSDTCLAFPYPHTGSSTYLFVGTNTGITTNALIRFEKPTLPDEWTLLDTPRVDLYYNEGFGSGDNPELTAVLLDFDWTESDTIDIDQLPSGQDLTITEQTTQIDSGRVTIALDYDFILDWLSETDTTRADTLGFTIRIEAPNASDKILKLSSISTTETSVSEDDTTEIEPLLVKPRIFFNITSPDTTGEPDTSEVAKLASDDIFLIDYDTGVSSDTLLIGSGCVYRSLVHFDLNAIDNDNYYNVINRAILKLNCFPIGSELPLTLAIKPYNILDSLTSDYRALELKNITNASTAIDTAVGELEMSVTNGVSYWINGSDAEGWLVLMSVAEETNIDRAGFYGVDADSVKIPRLSIEYTRYKR